MAVAKIVLPYANLRRLKRKLQSPDQILELEFGSTRIDRWF